MTRPHPPGDYDVVVVGSGPGGLQVGYCLSRLGARYAHISADDAPAGMFRRFPIYQRLISWTKPYAPAERTSREYERYDWNSLVGDDDAHRALVVEHMEGPSYFPSRDEMERGLAEFARRSALQIRYRCRWEATRREESGFVLETSDGVYRCKAVVFATGMTAPWKPAIPGLEHVPHYVEAQAARDYADRSVLIIGKRNSGFELADGLLPWARRIVLASPRPASISLMTHSIAAARARYMQPYEDHVLAGGNVVIDAVIDKVERTADGYRVHLSGTTRPHDLVLDVDRVIAATGFAVPLGDLPDIGVATFAKDRLPAQTPYWESASVPGIYFAGSATQGSVGLRKYGIPGTSAAVQGFRYNARVLCRHLAETHLGLEPRRTTIQRPDVVDHLLRAATRAPELWLQRSYLAEAVELDPGKAVRRGIVPLADFVDRAGPDGVAIAVETDAAGDIHPALYVRSGGKVAEHLLPSTPFHDYETGAHRAQAASAVAPVFG